MKKTNGIWVPSEDHFPISPQFEFYQRSKVIEKTLRRKTFIDVGGHVGVWTMYMAKYFNRVVSFEPLRLNRECLKKNIEGLHNVELIPFALGNDEESKRMSILNEGNVGTASIDKAGKYSVKTKRLDSFGYRDVDLIKIDTEGYELNVLKGARETIIKNKPVIILEVNECASRFGSSLKKIEDFFLEIGYTLTEQVSFIDYIFTPVNNKKTMVSLNKRIPSNTKKIILCKFCRTAQFDFIRLSLENLYPEATIEIFSKAAYLEEKYNNYL
ncbi:MAG: FkbM family methyltransferase, partial [Nitrospinae bacterium]|nr:FkbM family methyltransferase [Nitrospinota bacterium]